MKYTRKKVEQVCEMCEKIYLKDESEVKRNQKLGRKSFCSLECLGKSNFVYIKEYQNINITKLKPDNRKDKYTGLREFLRRIKNRNCDCNLSLDDLLQQWILQKGICVYSNVQLELPSYTKENNPIYTASLDRIDSSIGYTKENIQFISIAMNHMKNSMTHEQTLKLISLIKN